MSGTRTKQRSLARILAGALTLWGLATALGAQTAEELLRSVQSGEAPPAAPPAKPPAQAPPVPARLAPSPAPPKPAATDASARAARRERARRIVGELQQRMPAARSGGLKTGTAEDLLRGVQGGEPAPDPRGSPRATSDFDEPMPTASPRATPARAAPTFTSDGFDEPAPRRGFNLLRPAPAVAKRADPLADIFVKEQKGAEYAGTERCLACHQRYGEEGRASLSALYAVSEAIAVSQRRGCEGCHGPGSKHADGKIEAITNPRKLTKGGQSGLCFSCHAVSVRAGDPVVHFPGHSSNHVGCLNCHRVHGSSAEKFLKEEPNRLCMSCHRDVAAEFLRRSRHPIRAEEPSPRSSQRGGKMRCIDCHLNWSRRREPTGREPTIDTCQNCHAETRGPFLFSHDAGSAEMVDGCQACHLPHGSPNRHLLRASNRSLCLQCHSDFATGHFPGPTCTTTACHQDIHGSNTNVFLVR